MNKCYIIAAYAESPLSHVVSPGEHDFIICADGGYEKAISYGFTPDMVIGDFDSMASPSPADTGVEFLRYPIQKDESDTFLCVKYAIGKGFDEITIVGGLGGRLDHTLSNLQTLAHFSNKVKNISIVDEKNLATVVENASITIPKSEGWHLSIFSISDLSEGVTTDGLLYPLRNATLNNAYPVGLSNDFCAEEATIKVESGKLLVILSKD